jgi:predicted RNase H-like HicB family nuclease
MQPDLGSGLSRSARFKPRTMVGAIMPGKRFRIVIEKDEGGEFLGSFSELPGFHALSWSDDEFLQRIRTAVEGYRQSTRPAEILGRRTPPWASERVARKSWIQFEEVLSAPPSHPTPNSPRTPNGRATKRPRRVRNRTSSRMAYRRSNADRSSSH